MLEDLHATGFYRKPWQAFTFLQNEKSVDVMGDNRTYENPICIRIVEATDGMTATFAYIPHNILENMSRRIINEVDGVNSFNDILFLDQPHTHTTPHPPGHNMWLYFNDILFLHKPSLLCVTWSLALHIAGT